MIVLVPTATGHASMPITKGKMKLKYLLIAAGLAATTATSSMAEVTPEQAIALIKGGTLLYNRAMTTHPNEVWMDFGGRKVLILPLRAEDGSRCTWNYNRDWDGTKRFHFFVVNVPAALVAVHGKKDVRFGSDEEDGPDLIHHGDLVEFGRRERCYFAARGFNAGNVLRLYQNAAIILVEDGIDLNQLGLAILR
jgi:hypothetical protein